MAALHNRVSQKELKQRLQEETEPRATLSFYRYFTIGDPAGFRDDMYGHLQALQVFGRIYIAREGINAQMSIPRVNIDRLGKYIDSLDGLSGVRLNPAVDDNGKSFWVLKIKVREKILADGIKEPGFSMERRGKYLSPEEFNQLTEDPQTVIVDMRNHYEYEIGHFSGAMALPSDTFREQLPLCDKILGEHKDRNIIMYCTGGIRCEKASAFLLHRGFSRVFHLEGGIIHYANTVQARGLENKFLGKNFVFDERLGERVGQGIISSCHQCGKPSDRHVNCANPGCHLLFIQCTDCQAVFDGCCSETCREILTLPMEDQKIRRKGIDQGRNIFNKSMRRAPAESREGNRSGGQVG
jgi:UPF0176 protein